MSDERKARLGGRRDVGKALSLRGEQGPDGPEWIMSQAHHHPADLCAVQCPEQGCQIATDLGLDLGFAKQPCDLGIFCILSGTYTLFKL